MAFGKKRIYADTAATTPMSDAAQKELLRLLPLYGNPGSLYVEGVQAKKELQRARRMIAESVGAHSDEIIVTASGTEGNNLGIAGTLRPLLASGKAVHAITLAIEHPSVLEPLRALSKEGLRLTELSVDAQGLIDPRSIFDAINDTTALVSVQYINSEIGTIQPIREIAKHIRRVRKDRHTRAVSLPIYFHCDASQAPLWLPIRIENLGVDLMTLDAHKLQGPKGVGALVMRRGTRISPILYGGRQEQGLRPATEHVALIGAFATALKGAQEQAETSALRVSKIRDLLIREIQTAIAEVEIHGPTAAHRAANTINLSISGLDGETAVIAMDKEGIAISTRSTCSLEEKEQSHVLRAIKVPPERIACALRITLLPEVTSADARRIAQALRRVAKRYKHIAY